MSRLLFATVFLALLTSDSWADARKAAVPAPAVLPVALYGYAKPANCPGCASNSAGHQAHMYGQSAGFLGQHESFGSRLQRQVWWDEHECGPHGCPKPIGCGNFWTEKKFIFGSCRQFFGTADSTVGHHRHTHYR